MDEMREYGTLIKFGQKEHLVKLQEEGLFYMNHLPYFWEIEDDELRGDPFDCIVEVQRGQRMGLTLTNGEEVCMDGNWTLSIYPQEPEKIHIFCMYALRPFISGTFPVGEYALVVINRDDFMHRIESTIKFHRIRAKANLVEYVDDEYTGKLGPFRKLKRFAYQSEWRLVCLDGPAGPREIRVDSIRDISAIIRSDEVNKEIRVDFEQANALDRR